jgi:hypothetical protein
LILDFLLGQTDKFTAGMITGHLDMCSAFNKIEIRKLEKPGFLEKPEGIWFRFNSDQTHVLYKLDTKSKKYNIEVTKGRV